MENVQGWKTFCKVISILMIIEAVFGLLGAGLTGALGTLGAVAGATEGAAVGIMLLGIGVILVLASLFNLIAGIAGVRFVGDPTRRASYIVFTLFIALSILSSLASCASMTSGGVDTTTVVSVVVSLVLDVLALIGAKKIRATVR